MHTDRKGHTLRVGNRVLIHGVIVGLDHTNPKGPIAVNIGRGESASGSNISTYASHMELHPDEAPVSQPSADFMEQQEAARKEAIEKGGQTSPPELVEKLRLEREAAAAEAEQRIIAQREADLAARAELEKQEANRGDGSEKAADTAP
jgi:hypothetical protein